MTLFNAVQRYPLSPPHSPGENVDANNALNKMHRHLHQPIAHESLTGPLPSFYPQHQQYPRQHENGGTHGDGRAFGGDREAAASQREQGAGKRKRGGYGDRYTFEYQPTAGAVYYGFHGGWSDWQQRQNEWDSSFPAPRAQPSPHQHQLQHHHEREHKRLRRQARYDPAQPLTPPPDQDHQTANGYEAPYSSRSYSPCHQQALTQNAHFAADNYTAPQTRSQARTQSSTATHGSNDVRASSSKSPDHIPLDDVPAIRSPNKQPRVYLMARPSPQATYMAAAWRQPETSPISRPLLVILDLNGTLLYRKNKGSTFKPRPHLDEFLEYLFSNHKVMVWSSARQYNVVNMCKQFFTPEQYKRVVAIWSRDKLRLTPEAYKSNTQVYKQLSWIWQDKSIQAQNPVKTSIWDQSNTILLDDSVEKSASEPHNLVQIDEFEARPEQMKEDVLPQVALYLNTLRSQRDASAYIRAHPFVHDPKMPRAAAEAFAVERSRAHSPFLER